MHVPGYVLGERLGIGGFGEVFAARHKMIGRDAAIKILHAKYSSDPEAVARFVAEARVVNQISHPNIVEIFDFGQLDDGRQYCVMERIHGTTLRDLLRERVRLPLDEALPILRGIAEAIDAAHAAGVAHRDLKPDNVFVTAAGGVKLIDFGLAKLTRDDPSATPVTQTGSLFGTPLYMSPEQCRGKGVDTRTDLYAFGVLTYAVLSGELPFTGDAMEIALHHLNDEPDPPSRRWKELPAHVDRVVLALLAKDPANRPAPLVAAVDALSGVTSLKNIVRPPRPRRRRLIAGASLFGVLGVAGVALAVRGAKSSTASAGDEACLPAAQRLAGMWDLPKRTAIAVRFASVGRRDASATWDLIDRNMKGFLDAWATRWDAACKSPDRSRDPLLYAQRLTCLDTSLTEARGVIESLPPADPGLYSVNIAGAPVRASSLEDCDSVAMLRAQLPAPPPEHRAEVQRLSSELQSLEADRRAVGDMGAKPEEVERVSKRFTDLIRRLDAIGSPVAIRAADARGVLLTFAAIKDPRWRAQAVEALDDAARRAEAGRADAVLASVLTRRIALEVYTSNRRDIVEDAVRRTEAALTRIGRPGLVTAQLTGLRARYEAQVGHLDAAIAMLPPAIEPYEAASPVATFLNPRRALLDLLIMAGRFDEAMRQAEAIVGVEIREDGPIHYHVAFTQRFVATTAARTGDLERALRECDHVLATLDQLDHSQPALREFATSMRLSQLFYALRLGNAERIATYAAALGVESARWQEWANLAVERGSLELVRYALAHEAIPEPRRTEIQTWLDFATGVPGAKAPPGDDLARLDELAASGHWREVATQLEADHDEGPIGTRTAHVSALLGMARLELGDAANAIPPLERSMYALGQCCQDFHYFAPAAQFALARALWKTGGDKKRARWLAQLARDGFTRLGVHRERERQKVIAWLAQHP
ncbi:MAG TPA: serine/threonine-protein kinase [Kofleriaceae bacterium]|nr:serine/threonine-protein kinase [Kofleriaceae bacterium]